MKASLLFLLLTYTSWVTASYPQSAAALLVLKSGGSANEYSPVIEYTKVEFESSAALNVVLVNGRSTTITKSDIAGQFIYPDASVTLSGSEGAQALAAKRAEAVALVTKFPQTKSYLQPIVTDIDTSLQKLAAGETRVRGVWQPSSALAPIPVANPQADFASLTHAGITYQQVELTRLDNGSVVIKHNGGIARLSLTDASPELLTKVRSKASLFKDMPALKQLEIDGNSLSGAILLGTHGDTLLILHQGGLLKIQKDSLSEVQRRLLAAHNPTVFPSTMEKTNEQRAERLVLTGGSGTRDPKLGWVATTDERKAWEAAATEKFVRPNTQAYLTDVFAGKIKPPGGKLVTYEETLTFINAKIEPLEVGFSAANDCMIVRATEDDEVKVIAAFDARKLDASAITFGINHDGIAFVKLEGRDGAKPIMFYGVDYDDDALPLRKDLIQTIQFLLNDETSGERVARAFQRLILMMGGREGKL